jgi:hypothetical protein
MEQQPPQQTAAPPGPWLQMAPSAVAAPQQQQQQAAAQLGGAQHYAAAMAVALQQQQHQQQQQQQQLMQQMQAHTPLILQGKPISGGAPQLMGAAPQFPGSSGMPFAITLPGGTMLHPQQMQAPGSAAAAGYPQLSGMPTGLTFQPGSGAPMIRGHPLTVATSMPASVAAQQKQQLAGAGAAAQGQPFGGGVKLEPGSSGDRPSSSHSANTSAGGLGSDGSPLGGGGSAGTPPGSAGMNKSRYRGVSYDRKKAKWRVQIKVAALGKSGVSVGYFDTEEAAAR